MHTQKYIDTHMYIYVHIIAAYVQTYTHKPIALRAMEDLLKYVKD